MTKKLRIGVFGASRGFGLMNVLNKMEEAEIVAVLEQRADKVERVKSNFPEAKIVNTFEELLDCGLDAVILANFFPEHAKYAIQALKKDVSVFSETIPAVTLKECAELTEAAEASKGIYMLAENYPFSRGAMEVARVYQTGALGKVIFAEGEYVHPLSKKTKAAIAPTPDHWRNHLPRTYYMTHSMMPLVLATGLLPKKVIGKIASKPTDDGGLEDGVGIILTEMEGGAVFRCSGSCSFGPEGNWYRLGCEKGGIETVRGDINKVRLSYNSYELTDENREHGTDCTYSPAISEIGKQALSTGHSGGDYWVTWHFIQALLGNEEPVIDVYKAVSVAAAGILAWRSALENSKQMDIPDFKNQADREKAKLDDLNPFAVDGKEPDLPCRYYGEVVV